MKLYAKVSSERATKGQGGQEYVRAMINDELGQILFDVIIKKDLTWATFESGLLKTKTRIDHVGSDDIFLNNKANKQKDKTRNPNWFGNEE